MLAVQSRKRKRLHNKISQQETGEDTNFDIVERKKTKKKSEKPKGLTASEKNAKRKLKKKLEKIKEKKEQKEERERILKSLEKHAVSSEQLNLFHSSCGRKANTLLVQEQVKRSAVIVNHKKKKKKCGGKLDKLLHPVEKPAPVTSSSESSSESEEEPPQNEETPVPDPAEVAPKELTHSPEVSKSESPVKPSGQKLPAKRKDQTPRKAVSYVSIERDAEIQEARLQLPILGEEQVIVEKITENDIVVIVGATGSGKTTQVPQFLFEAGYGSETIPGLIGVTEPRRVAAITTCQRVKKELNIPNVSYQIRYEGNVTEDTKIKFMTDGILLRELQSDFLLSKYCVVVIDEAHERSVNTDILIGMLSRVVPLRRKQNKPLKLIIMSATLRVTDFTQNSTLFPSPPPVVDVGARQHTVTVHHNKETREDYVREAYKKVCKLHRTLPPGDVLVFLTGVQEINRMIHLLRKTFPEKPANKGEKEDEKNDEDISAKPVQLDKYDPYENKDDSPTEPITPSGSSDQTETEEQESSESEDEDIEPTPHDRSLPLLALPLYSALPPDQQQRVFNSQSDNYRLVVVATNVAETSLTIPGITYVVDSGKVKTKEYCPVTGMSQFRVVWVSHASAEQRAGRAGRTGPGHCYRLYSTAVMGNVMEKHTEPEITKKPIDGLVLQMKNLNIHRILNFPFPTPPSLSLIETAEKELQFLDLLKPGQTVNNTPVNKITDLGKQCVNLPVSPRFAKLLLLSVEQNVTQFALTLVAALSVGHLFTGPIPAPFKPRAGPAKLLGDFMVILTAVGAWEHSGAGQPWSAAHHLRYRALVEIRQLRRQLANILAQNHALSLEPLLKPPTPGQIISLRRILTVCLGDHIGKLEEGTGSTDLYSTEVVEENVQIHRESVLYGLHTEYVAFCTLEQENSGVKMRVVLGVEEEWLPTLLPNKCTFSDPLDQPPPAYSNVTGEVMCHRTSTFGVRSWVLPAANLPYPVGMKRFREFAAALLEGKVISSLQHYDSLLLARPGVLRKSWATLQPRAEAFLKQLVNKDIDTKDKLLKMWKVDGDFLYSAFSQWLPQSTHSELRTAWPPVALASKK